MTSVSNMLCEVFLLCFIPFSYSISYLPENETYHRNIVEYVTKKAKLWKAELNRFMDPIEVLDSFYNKTKYQKIAERYKNMSFELDLNDTLDHMKFILNQNITLPKSYDTRKAWYQCWTVHQVSDQASCGSCWAVSAAAVISDRICIASKGKIQKQISAEDLISCCSDCGSGCQGLSGTLTPFEHWQNIGVVTGGSYGSNEGCRPYSFPPNCGSPCSVLLYNKTKTPDCEKTCNSLYGKSYESDLIKSKNTYWLNTPVWYSKRKIYALLDQYTEKFNTTRDELEITLVKMDLFLHGPLFTCFSVHEDFYHYKSGIYYSKDGPGVNSYGHCVKLLGWGWEGEQEYWIYANTWGRRWGENGFYRVHISELPREICAGIPDL